jgi:hypothetical protein
MAFDPDTPLVVEQLDSNCWELKAPLVYHGKERPFTLPPDFRTDFATVPFFLTWLVPRYGNYTNAAVLHDWLLDETDIKRCDCDGIFRRALRELGVPFVRRWVMWAAVRLGAMRREPALCGAREGIAFIMILLVGLAVIIAPALAVLVFLFLFWVLEILCWIVLRLWPARDREKQLNAPAFPWPRTGDCRGRPAGTPPAR